MKKLLSILLVISLLAIYAVPVNAADTSGKCGDNLTWTLSGNALTISGTGPMYDYSEENPAPWSQQSLRIFQTKIEEGVTSIGAYAFAHRMTNLTWIAASVKTIGNKAFANYYNEELYFLGVAPEFAEDFASGGSITIYSIDWDADIKQNYGGTIAWKEAALSLDVANSKQLVGLNEAFKPEDFTFTISGTNSYSQYIPRNLTLSPYDNSAYGEKNITITADGNTFDFTYFVTDGTNHLNLITVEFGEIPRYSGGLWGLVPTVKMGNTLLTRDEHFTCNFQYARIGNDAKVTIVGKGIAEGFEKTFYYPIVKRDISNQQSITVWDAGFTGMPVEPTVNVANLDKGTEIEYLYQNNINPGTASLRGVGIGYYYGEVSGTFEVILKEADLMLKGNCIGQVGGELSTDIPIVQKIICPAPAEIEVNMSSVHIAAYQLYRVDGEEPVLLEEYQSEPGYRDDTQFAYDFSSVYEDDADKGGAIFLLSYSYVTENGSIYAGAAYLIVPAKVGEATSMTMVHVENDGDFRKEYFNLIGDDGVLGPMTWHSSDPSVAEIENGTVTMKKPGTVTISGQCGDMVETYALTVPQLNLTEGIIFDYSEEKGARVIYDARLLTEGTDYVLSVEETGKGVTVTATGCGLFTGELMKTFDGLDSLADPHTHSFDNGDDDICDGCGFSRDDTSTKAISHQYVVGGEEITDYYATMEEALSVATSGTIKLQGDTTVETAVLKPGVTLDLNGYTLTAELLVAMDGATVLDGGEACIGGGLLKIAKGDLVLSRDNGSVVPVWNGVDGYIFTKVIFQQVARTAEAGAAQYIFLPDFSNVEAASLLADGGLDNGLKIQACLTWNDGYSQQFYTYNDDLVKQVFDGTGSLAFDLTVTGIAGISDLVASPVVITDSGAWATTTGTDL